MFVHGKDFFLEASWANTAPLVVVGTETGLAVSGRRQLAPDWATTRPGFSLWDFPMTERAQCGAWCLMSSTFIDQSQAALC